LTVDARHQQFVVVGVEMADRGNNGKSHGGGVESTPSRAASDPAAASCRRMARDRLGTVGRAARELFADRRGEPGLEPHILVGPSRRVVLPAPGAKLRVRQALLFGPLNRLGLGQNALALVSLSRSAPPNGHRRKAAGLLRPSGQRGVTGRQEVEMPEVGAVQTQRARILHEQKAAGAAARCARPFVDRNNDDEIRWLALPFDLSLGEVRRHPVRAVRALDGSVAADAELQPPAVASASDIVGFRRLELIVPRPPSEHRHRVGDLAQVGLNDALQGIDPALPPQVNMRRRQPAQAEKHVDRADELLLGQRCIGGSRDTLL
jgi:hypothetical protein